MVGWSGWVGEIAMQVFDSMLLLCISRANEGENGSRQDTIRCSISCALSRIPWHEESLNQRAAGTLAQASQKQAAPFLFVQILEKLETLF